MPVIGSTGLPIGPRDGDWDGGAARARVVDFYTSGDSTNWSQVKRAFFWVVPGKEDLKTGYRLGFGDIVDGKLVAMPRGLFAVAGGHGVTRTQIPSSAKTTIKGKVNTYYRRMKKKWPNDDFDFDPPFPEVKDMADEDRDWDEIPEAFEELLAKFYGGLGAPSVQSFADLAALEAIRETVGKVFKTVHDFEFLAQSIARQSETPDEMLRRIKDLSLEMAAVFSKMSSSLPGSTSEIEDQDANDKGLTSFINSAAAPTDESWDIDQCGSTALLKNAKGDQFFYGRFTNNLWDKDGEVLITEAHQEFVDYLDSHPDEAPQLWDWHEKNTAKTHQAIWWDFADGFLHCIWPVTEKEAAGIKAFMEEFEPGMSHGFKVLERDENDGRQIARYKTFEASILPLEFAANEWTTFDLLEKLEEKTKEERAKMFSPKKQRALELLSLGEYINPLGKASETDASALDEAGAQRKAVSDGQDKEKGSDSMEDKEKDQVEDVAGEATTTEVPEAPVESPTTEVAPTEIEALQASIVQGFELLTARLDGLAKTVEDHGKALKGIKEKKGESPSVAAWVASQKATTAVGDQPEPTKTSDNGEVEDDDPLFGEGPMESAYDLDGHLLAGV